ncbi:MAG TPA: hypothetical protein VN836_06655 [Verrucomicrobiae bacterium]|nr:hypothetical protein [Verrucomicrobiae bacterium]
MADEKPCGFHFDSLSIFVLEFSVTIRIHAPCRKSPRIISEMRDTFFAIAKGKKERPDGFSSSSLTGRVVECPHADGDLSGQF